MKGDTHMPYTAADFKPDATAEDIQNANDLLKLLDNMDAAIAADDDKALLRLWDSITDEANALPN